MLYKVNKQGYIINEASITKIKPEYFLVLAKIKEKCIKYINANLLSIYVRGSASVGRAIKNFSDLDYIIITKRNFKNLKWISKFSDQLKQEYPFITFFDLTVIPISFLKSKKFSNLKLNLKTRSVCIYGEDIANLLPNYRADRELALLIYKEFLKDISYLQKIFSGKIKNPSYLYKRRKIDFWCIWTMRVILRTGLALLMTEKAVFTQDLRTCYDLFSKKYPDHKIYMKQALAWSLEPTSSKKKIIIFLNNFLPKFKKLWQTKI